MSKLGYFLGGAVAAVTLIAVATALDSTCASTGSGGDDNSEDLAPLGNAEAIEASSSEQRIPEEATTF